MRFCRLKTILSKICFIFILAVIVVLLSACSSLQKREAVYVPVKTEVELPVLPPKSGDSVKDVINILEYTNKLECNVKYSNTGESCLENLDF